MDPPEWISRARHVKDLTVDVGFVISPSLYYGPDEGISSGERAHLQDPLYQPQIPLTHKLVLTRDSEGFVAELVKYYKDVLRLVVRYQKEVEHAAPSFWMRPLIFSLTEPEITVPFPWYDTREESGALLDALENSEEGLVFDDLDQAWTFDLYASGDRFILRHGCLDDGVEYSVLSTGRAALTIQATMVKERMNKMLENLEAAMGKDYWSRRFWFPKHCGRSHGTVERPV